MKEPILKIRNLSKTFSVYKDQLIAVNNINLDLFKGEILGLVGESGSGKSTLAKLIVQLITPTEGTIYFEDQDIFKLKAFQKKELKKNIQIIFQNPFSSLNPLMSVEQILKEPLIIHNLVDKNTNTYLKQLLDLVGLAPSSLKKYPHEFSGGQRQRITIARALALKPKLLICDEPISALDVSIQAQIIHLLIDLQKQLNLTYLFITHNLVIAQSICDQIAVMHLGKIVEMGSTETIFKKPSHPYTKALISSILSPIPILEKQKNRLFLEKSHSFFSFQP